MSNRRPGVNITEIDLSRLVESETTGTPAGIIGTAERGPAFVPVVFDRLEDWQMRFGSAEGHLGPIAANEWLREADAALYLRLLGVGNGERRLGDGNVKEAGFVVGEDRVFDADPNGTGAVTWNPFAHDDGSSPNPGQIPGRTYFLGALHQDKPGFETLKRAGIDTSLEPKPVVRAVLFTPKGVAATLLAGEDFGVEPLDAEALDPLDPGSYGDNSGQLGGSPAGYLVRSSNSYVTSRLFLNGHKPTPEWGNDVEFSFDPRSSVYLTKVLNTDPSKINEAGHCLYSWWEIDPREVEITSGTIFPIQPLGDDTASLGAFCLPGAVRGGLEFEEERPNYENFEERYAEPLTPWVLSEELPGGERKRLFRVHVIDSGEGANTAYKVAISNIVRRKDDWTRFDLTLRDWGDSDTDPQVIERFSGLTLDPDSSNYIARRIGDRRLKYVWDANPENQGLFTEGLYENRSRRIWIEVSDEVDAGLNTPDVVPLAHEGLPHITVDGFDGSEGLLLWDETFLGDSNAEQAYSPTAFSSVEGDGNVYSFPSSGAFEISVDLSDSSVFDLEADALIATLDIQGEKLVQLVYDDPTPITASDFASELDAFLVAKFGSGAFDVNESGGIVTVDSPTPVSGTLTIYTANEVSASVFSVNLLSGIRQAPVPFRDSLRKGLRSNRINPRIHWGFKFNVPNLGRDGSLENWSRFFPDFGDIPFWAKEANVVPQETYGSILDVNEYNNNLFTLERVAAPLQDPAAPDSPLSGSATDWAASGYVRDGDQGALEPNVRFVEATDFERPGARPFLKFSFPVFGGFDGLNVFDKERAGLSDIAVAKEKEFGIVEQGIPEVDPDNATNPILGPTATSWLKAAEVMGSNDDVDIQILVTPGLRHRSVTDEICRLTEDRLDAIYLLDPEIIPDDPGPGVDALRYTSEIRDINLDLTLERWQERTLDNTFVGAFLPDVIIPNPETGRIKTVPASVGALGVYALNDALAEPWFAAAGVTRGELVSTEGIPLVLGEEAQARLYDAGINPIIDKKSHGPLVWGNKTTRQTESVLNRLNVRRLLIEIRRRVRTVSRGFKFEPNEPETLARFQALVAPILVDIQRKRGVQKFVVFIDTSTTTQLDVENGVIRGIIGVQPTQSAEFAEIDFELRGGDE